MIHAIQSIMMLPELDKFGIDVFSIILDMTERSVH
jgi:hypothetical protein